MTLVACHVIHRPALLDGREVRFLRKYNGKSAREFADLLHIDHTHLSKIENNRVEIGASLDKLVRLLAVNLDRNLNDALEPFLKQLPNI
jgi:transcriptional regulator with XRE-family HTH domain